MPRLLKFAPLFLLLAGLFLASCAKKDDGGGGSGGGSATVPTLGTIIWRSNGGDSTIGVGGRAGDFEFECTVGDFMLDDGRSRPTIATNFLTAAVMTDNVVTYAELVSIQAPTGTTSVAFNLTTGTGFDLPAGVTLNLSDAAAVITTISINTDAEVSIAGDVVLTRTGANAVNLNIDSTSSDPAGMVLTGHFDGRGDAGLSGGGLFFQIYGSGGGMLALFTTDLSGGDATAGDGGVGGSGYFYANGDLITRSGAFQGNGGNGETGGGTGGEFDIGADAAIATVLSWSAQAHGGNTVSGTGGYGGLMSVYSQVGDIEAFAYFEGNGGDSVTGSGGNSGRSQFTLYGTGATLSGQIVVNLSSGNVTGAGGAGGLGNSCGIGADVMADFTLTAVINGGSSIGTSGSSDGRVGGALWAFADTITDCVFNFTANGGSATETGGAGGKVTIRERNTAGTFNVTNLTLNANLNGGAGGSAASPNYGGAGGSTTFGRPSTGTAALTTATSNVTLNVFANGGVCNSTSSSPLGGMGGAINCGHYQGTMAVTVNAELNGGASSTGAEGGYGGNTVFIMEDGILNVTANILANGGTGVTGGEGGDFRVEPNAASAGGSATVVANIELKGADDVLDGAFSMDAGYGGDVYVSCGTGGSFTATVFNSDQRGGDSLSGWGGQGGDFITGLFGGDALFSAGNINLNAGASNTLNGSDPGNSTGRIELNTEDHSITFNPSLSMVGGTATNGAGGTGGLFTAQINLSGDAQGGSLIINGDIDMSGGAGTSAGGNAVDIYINSNAATSGSDVTINSTITANGGAASSGTGGTGSFCTLSVYGDVNINGTILARGGTGVTGGNGSSAFDMSTLGTITVSGIIDSSGGNGSNAGGTGAATELGIPSRQPSSIMVTSTAVIRSNGGTGTTVGLAGTITFDPTGAGGTNLTEQAGSLVETNDGGGTPAANITRN